DLPDFAKEDAEEHLKLAVLWDAKGLLQLVPPLPTGDAFQRSCRIFNSYKSPEADRQIGDRRPANRAELHLTGPSQKLPQGSLLAAYRLPRRKAQLTTFVTDRRDFYHQVAVTRARADCNRLPFAYPAKAFRGDHLGMVPSTSTDEVNLDVERRQARSKQEVPDKGSAGDDVDLEDVAVRHTAAVDGLNFPDSGGLLDVKTTG
ncbi:unnamed protein product, partial [Symbiodinium microadriaticum]